MRHAELKSGTISIAIATEPSLSSQPMMDTIKEGVTHSKMQGDGLERGEASAGSSERSPASLTRGVCRRLIQKHDQSSIVAALSIATRKVLRPFEGKSP